MNHLLCFPAIDPDKISQSFDLSWIDSSSGTDLRNQANAESSVESFSPEALLKQFVDEAVGAFCGDIQQRGYNPLYSSKSIKNIARRYNKLDPSTSKLPITLWSTREIEFQNRPRVRRSAAEIYSSASVRRSSRSKKEVGNDDELEIEERETKDFSEPVPSPSSNILTPDSITVSPFVNAGPPDNSIAPFHPLSSKKAKNSKPSQPPPQTHFVISPLSREFPAFETLLQSSRAAAQRFLASSEASQLEDSLQRSEAAVSLDGNMDSGKNSLFPLLDASSPIKDPFRRLSTKNALKSGAVFHHPCGNTSASYNQFSVFSPVPAQEISHPPVSDSFEFNVFSFFVYSAYGARHTQTVELRGDHTLLDLRKCIACTAGRVAAEIVLNPSFLPRSDVSVKDSGSQYGGNIDDNSPTSGLSKECVGGSNCGMSGDSRSVTTPPGWECRGYGFFFIEGVFFEDRALLLPPTSSVPEILSCSSQDASLVHSRGHCECCCGCTGREALSLLKKSISPEKKNRTGSISESSYSLAEATLPVGFESSSEASASPESVRTSSNRAETSPQDEETHFSEAELLTARLNRAFVSGVQTGLGPVTLGCARTPLNSLRMRPGANYVFSHLGGCEHLFVLMDIRVESERQLSPQSNGKPSGSIDHPEKKKNQFSNSSAISSRALSGPGSAAYPRTTHSSVRRTRRCGLCEAAPADLSVIGDCAFVGAAGLVCRECWDLLHFDEEGNFIADAGVSVVPYFGDPL